MTDLADLRRRAAQQAGTGNYWAGKVVALIDRCSESEAALQRAQDLMRAARALDPTKEAQHKLIGQLYGDLINALAPEADLDAVEDNQ